MGDLVGALGVAECGGVVAQGFDFGFDQAFRCFHKLWRGGGWVFAELAEIGDAGFGVAAGFSVTVGFDQEVGYAALQFGADRRVDYAGGVLL